MDTHEFSSINVTRNNYVLAGLEIGEEFSNIIQGSLPTHLTCDFLHEATHHWCFSFLVGYALALKRTEAEARLVSNPIGSNIQIAYDCEQKIEIVRNVLDPIAEGLAIYSEFHLEPSNTIDHPILVYLSMNFLGPDLGLNKDQSLLERVLVLDKKVTSLLRSERSSVTQLKTLEHILSLKLSIKENGHYLVGYLFVLTFENFLRERLGAEIVESGLLLEWLCRYVFDDGSLALLLIEDSAQTTQEEILDYMDGRLDSLFHERTVDCFRDFVNERRERRESMPDPIEGTGTEALVGSETKICNRARQLIHEKHSEIVKFLPESDVGLALYSIIAARHLTVLGRIEGKTSVSSNQRVNFTSDRLACNVGALKESTPQNGDGSLVHFFSFQYGQVTAIYIQDTAVSMIVSDENLEPASYDTLLCTVGLFVGFDRISKKISKFYTDSLVSLNPDYRDLVAAKYGTRIEELYLTRLFHHLSSSDRMRLLDSLRDAGFFSLLEYDLGAFKEYVSLQSNRIIDSESKNTDRLQKYNKKMAINLLAGVDRGRLLFG